MRVLLVAAIAANILPNAAHAHGSAANGTLLGHGAPAADVFAQILASLSPAGRNPPSVLPAVMLNLLGTKTPSPAASLKSVLSASSTAAPAANRAADALVAMKHASPDAAARPLKPGTQAGSAGKPAPAQKLANVAPGTGAASDSAQAPADPNTVLAQLLATEQLPQPVPTTPKIATPQIAGNAKAEDVPAAADILAAASVAPTDKTAAGIVAGGATIKPASAAKSTASTADSAKTQSQNSTASALAELSTATTRSFTDQSTSTSHALPIHALAEHKDGNNSTNNGSNGQPNNPHSQNAVPAPANDVHANAPTAPAAPQPAPAADNTPAPAQSPTDGGALAATNGVAPNGTPAALATSAQVHADLQVTTANPNAVPDTSALAVTIATKSQAGVKHFDIRLDPPELGRVDVRLSVNDAGKAQASLTVEKPQTLELLQKDSTHLERALKEAGLDLSQNGLNFSLKGQQQQSGNGNSPSSRGRALNVRAVAAVEAAPSTISLSGVGASDARLDIRV
jgi:flagellar hook-length control protein FliK